MPTKTIKVDTLARVEGEGALFLKLRDGRVEEAQLKIYEPPRFFEALLRGRSFAEAPDITARICGICPVAYQMSAVHAMEMALGLKVEGPLRALRRLLYCGEWIESHALHIVLLHAPDFLGYPDAITMAREHGDIVKQGLAIKKTGNAILRVLGGREIHPINVQVGGFHKIPPRAELLALTEDLKRAADSAETLADWTSGLPFPEFEQDYEFVALRHGAEYPFNEGRIVSSEGLDIPVPDYPAHFAEIHEPHSTALHSVLKARGNYLVGPMARFHLNRDRLTPRARAAAAKAGLMEGCRNPFRSIQLRAIETLFAIEEALAILADYAEPDAPFLPAPPRAGVGHAATEAPRGLLYHRYELREDGAIETAVIVPPTSQNQKTIEEDVRKTATAYIDAGDEVLRHRCEQAIRNYDPCISCATHFLKLTVDRGPGAGP